MNSDDPESNCPRCGKPMRAGYIQCGNRIAWVPKVSKLSVEPSLQKEAVVLSKQNRFQINVVRAYLCEDCQHVLIIYADSPEESTTDTPTQ
jgi:hypothetical protein